MINLVKQTGHLSNSFMFTGIGGIIGLICYYYWTKEISRIIMEVVTIIVLLVMLATTIIAPLEEAVTTMLGYFSFIVIGGIVGLIVGAIVGEPKWRKEL